MKKRTLMKTALVVALAQGQLYAGEKWSIDTLEEWKKATAESKGMTAKEGLLIPADEGGVFRSVIKKFNAKQKPKSLTIGQSTAWDTWKEIPSIKPKGASNAPIFLPVKDGDYYFFARGGRGGYRTWHSTDLKTWTKHEPFAPKEGKAGWSTTAEQKDGEFYLYSDVPNDGKPHVTVNSDPKGGKPGEAFGMAFDDQTGGSDCGVLRDEDGTWHLFYEDWSAISGPPKFAYDSPIAGHATSKDGKTFKQQEGFSVDERPNGDNGGKRYRLGESPAYGDWTAIKVGKQYYLFGDHHHKEPKVPMSCAYFVSDDPNKTFSYGGTIDCKTHPDPTIGFAEGAFYLIIQNPKDNREIDYVSPGPWVDGVEARAGVDIDGDNKIDKYTEWKKIKESYKLKEGFSRIVERTPASLDLSTLPEGKGFQFEVRLSKPADIKALPILDSATLSFE